MKPIDMKMLINKLENINEGEDDYKTLGKGGYAAAHEQDSDLQGSITLAREIGEQVAGNVILADHMRASEEGTERSSPEEINAMIDIEIETLVSHMQVVAKRYVRSRYYE